MQRALTCFGLILLISEIQAFSPSVLPKHKALQKQAVAPRLGLRMQAGNGGKDSPDKVVQKFGLEAGLLSTLKNKDGAPDAKELLKKYGSAYLVTSISLSLVSFALCYILISQGVDVASLLSKLGIETSSKTEAVGTFALAYAAHKAASPIRFPPTVALTPVIAKKLFNKEVVEE